MTGRGGGADRTNGQLGQSQVIRYMQSRGVGTWVWRFGVVLLTEVVRVVLSVSMVEVATQTLPVGGLVLALLLVVEWWVWRMWLVRPIRRSA